MPTRTARRRAIPTATQQRILSMMARGAPLAHVYHSDEREDQALIAGEAVRSTTLAGLLASGWVEAAGQAGWVTGYRLTATGRAVVAAAMQQRQQAQPEQGVGL
jgi:hypothetical protein